MHAGAACLRSLFGGRLVRLLSRQLSREAELDQIVIVYLTKVGGEKGDQGLSTTRRGHELNFVRIRSVYLDDCTEVSCPEAGSGKIVD